MDALRTEGVMCNVHYTPLHRNLFYNQLSGDNLMPGSMEFFGRLLRLHIYPSLTKGEREIVVRSVKKILSNIK